ncbi:MAG TPA: hypothetical protein PLE45_07650, partial [Spirochaetota bacterium]|nr:hypothetical protein [Spirochaetota bacterium]HPP05254.1 hypothetical protein [Spirochaetota bacterium]
MKSKIFIIIFLSFFTLNIIADETEDIKDSNSLFLIVIPLFNISAKKEFDNISFEIQNSLIKKINSYNYFSIYNWEKAEYIFYANNFDYNKLIFEDDQQKIKELTGVDITIVGFYKITENYIHIYLKCFEKKDKVESFSFEYLNDYDENKIKDAIEYSTKEMANMVFEKYKKKIIVKNRIVDLTKEARGKFSIKSRNIAGYVLFGSGAILTLSGIISFAINTSYNKEKEKDLFPKYLNTEITADDYNNFSRDWLIFSLSSLSTMTVGISTLFISIPMFAYGNRSLNLKNKIGFAIYSSGISLFAIGLSFMLFDFTYYF